MNQELKEVLDRARGELSMVEFAKKCDISANTLYRWIRGHQKAALRTDIIHKICDNAAPDSGVTEDQVYDASILSVEGENRQISSRGVQIRDISTLMRSCALQMCVGEGYSIKELSGKQKYDYSLIIDGRKIFHFDLHAAPGGSFHKGQSVEWWRNALNMCVGQKYMNPEPEDTWVHLVIATNDAKETALLKELLKQPHCNGNLQMSVIILDLETKKFIEPEYELGIKKETFMKQSSKKELLNN